MHFATDRTVLPLLCNKMHDLFVSLPKVLENCES